jgi:hypothetical protein
VAAQHWTPHCGRKGSRIKERLQEQPDAGSPQNRPLFGDDAAGTCRVGVEAPAVTVIFGTGTTPPDGRALGK